MSEELSLVVILKVKGNKYIQNNGIKNEESKTKYNNYQMFWQLEATARIKVMRR